MDSIQAGTGARFSLLPPENATGNYVKVVQRVPVKIVFDEPLPAGHTIGPGLSVVPDVQVEFVQPAGLGAGAGRNYSGGRGGDGIPVGFAPEAERRATIRNPMSPSKQWHRLPACEFQPKHRPEACATN